MQYHWLVCVLTVFLAWDHNGRIFEHHPPLRKALENWKVCWGASHTRSVVLIRSSLGGDIYSEGFFHGQVPGKGRIADQPQPDTS